MSLARIGGVLLAAGTSRRFGSDKRFARLPDGQTLLLRAASCLQQAVDECLLVVGSGDDPLLFEGILPGWRIVHAVDSALGMGASLAAGVRDCPIAWQGLLVALADKPFVSPATVNAVRRALDDDIVVPRHAGEWGHPVGFPRRLFEAMENLRGESGARRIIEPEAGRCHFLDVDDPGVLFDVDTPDALRSLAAQFC